MTPDSKQRLSEFLSAIDDVGKLSNAPLAACHHSAVEVNDWVRIQAAMADAAGVTVSKGKPKAR